jgi:hypothetical protein
VFNSSAMQRSANTLSSSALLFQGFNTSLHVSVHAALPQLRRDRQLQMHVAFMLLKSVLLQRSKTEAEAVRASFSSQMARNAASPTVH